MSSFIVAYKYELPDDNWFADSSHSTLDEAKAQFNKLAEARAIRYGRGKRAYTRTIRMVAVFPDHLWNYGLPAGRPRLLIDYTDKSGWPITAAAAGLINSRNSDEI